MKNSLPVNLKQIIETIYRDKKPKAHLCLDLGCTLAYANPKSMEEILAEILDFFKSLGETEILIDLDAHRDKHQLVFTMYTNEASIVNPGLSILKRLGENGGELRIEFEPEKYYKWIITFNN